MDEADKLLSPGLAPQMDRLRDLLGVGPDARPPGGRTVILASATMPAAVAGPAAGWLRADRAAVVIRGEGGGGGDSGDAAAPPPTTTSALRPAPAITQAVHVCAAHKKTGKLLKHLASINAAAAPAARHRPRVAVFVNRIATASAVAAAVGGAGHKVALLHGGRPQAARDAALAAFRAGAATVLVATDVAARGLHIPTLRHVVNYDFPPNLETYAHRIGRAGRLEDGGHAFSFFTRPLAPLARPLLALLDGAGAAVDPNLVRLADAYDEARARVARLPDVGGDGGGGEDAAKAARRAAVGELLAEAAGDKKKKKKKKSAKKQMGEEVEEGEEAPSSDDTSDEEEEEAGGPPGDDGDDDRTAATRQRRRAKPLAKADLPGLYRAAGRPKAAAGGGSGDDTDGGGGGGGDDDDDDDGPPAWTLVAAGADGQASAPAAPTNKRRKALPGRLRKKQAAERARKGAQGV